MKKISYWAKTHIWESRVLIVIMWLLINIIGIFAGRLMTEINISLPEYYWTACILFAAVLCIYYPHRNAKSSRSSANLYVRRKAFDFILGLVTFFMIIYTGNHWKNLFSDNQTAHASVMIPVPKDSLRTHPLIKSFLMKIKSGDVSSMSTKEKVKLIKNQVRAVNSDKEISKGTKTLLIVLSVLLGISLLMGVALLSCSIACSGSEALAVIVGLGGAFLIIFFTVKLIKHISRMKEKEKIVKEKTEAEATK